MAVVAQRTREFMIPIPAGTAEALAVIQRDRDVNALIAQVVGADPMGSVDVQLSLSVPPGSYPSHWTAADVAQDVCRKMAAVFESATDRIAPTGPQRPLKQYQHVA